MSSATAKRAGVFSAVVLALLGAGLAFAAYLSSGEGSGQTASSVAANSVISPQANGSQLYPASTTTYTVNVTNPNPYPVRVTSITAASSQAAASGACPAGTITSPSVANPSGVIAPNGTGVYSLVATMSVDPANACQGQSFTMPLTAQLASAAS